MMPHCLHWCLKRCQGWRLVQAVLSDPAPPRLESYLYRSRNHSTGHGWHLSCITPWDGEATTPEKQYKHM